MLFCSMDWNVLSYGMQWSCGDYDFKLTYCVRILECLLEY